MNDEKPYLEQHYTKLAYNPDYGDDRVCQCGHTYYRHFDFYEDDPVARCKYCGCPKFVESAVQPETLILSKEDIQWNNFIGLFSVDNRVVGVCIHEAFISEMARELSIVARIGEKDSELEFIAERARNLERLLRQALEKA